MGIVYNIRKREWMFDVSHLREPKRFTHRRKKKLSERNRKFLKSLGLRLR